MYYCYTQELYEVCCFTIAQYNVVGSGTPTAAEKLGRILGNPLSDVERTILYTRFQGFVKVLEEGPLKLVEARKLLNSIRSVLQSQTVRRLCEQGLLFNGIISGAGGAHSVIYSVYEYSSGEAKCAKVYSNVEEAQNEFDMSVAIHSLEPDPNFVAYSNLININHTHFEGTVYALIMPRYNDSLQNFLSALLIQPFDARQSCKLAIALLRAGSKLFHLGLAHCDIKPNNIMIVPSSFVLIDFGSMVAFGQEVKEYTQFNYLDAQTTRADHKIDLYCIASTLAMCVGLNVGTADTPNPLSFSRPQTATALKLCLSSFDHPAAKLACICLHDSPSFSCVDALYEAENYINTLSF